MLERNLEHPVWEVYNLQRTTRLNCKYYTILLNRTERANWWIQLLIASSLPTSAIAGYGLWETEFGSEIWKIILFFASFFAFLQPFLKLTEKIKNYDSILTGYLTLDYDLQALRIKIINTKEYIKSHKSQFESAQNRKKIVGVKEQGLKIDKKLLKKLTMEVNKELPARNFFIPKD